LGSHEWAWATVVEELELSLKGRQLDAARTIFFAAMIDQSTVTGLEKLYGKPNEGD
jgi:hypothetical protein